MKKLFERTGEKTRRMVEKRDHETHKKKLCDLSLKNPKKMITFNHLLAKSRPVLLKELADK